MEIYKKQRKQAHVYAYARKRIKQSGNKHRKQSGVMRESYIEKRFCTEAKKRGMWAVKFVSPGLAGVPDRLLLIPGGRVAFAELKAPGGRLRPLQERRKAQLEKLGFAVYVIDNIDSIGGILDEIQST